MQQLPLRAKTYTLIESGFSGSAGNKLVSSFIVLLIVANVLAIIAESYQPIGSLYQNEFYWFNLISVAIFTIEYITRVWVSVEANKDPAISPLRARLKYMISGVAIIDLLAIAPIYLTFIMPIDLRYLRMLRMLRLLKLTHYFKGLRLFISVLKQELATIGAAIFIMIILVILSASIMYSVEHTAQPEVFDSIPSAIWWAVVTMTTVGYGDVTPVTFLGKFIAIFIMLLGVGVVALPAAMLAAKFGEELRERKKHLEIEVINALKDGVVTETERAELNQLVDSLDLSSADLQALIDTTELENEHDMICPHCKKLIKPVVD